MPVKLQNSNWPNYKMSNSLINEPKKTENPLRHHSGTEHLHEPTGNQWRQHSVRNLRTGKRKLSRNIGLGWALRTEVLALDISCALEERRDSLTNVSTGRFKVGLRNRLPLITSTFKWPVIKLKDKPISSSGEQEFIGMDWADKVLSLRDRLRISLPVDEVSN